MNPDDGLRAWSEPVESFHDDVVTYQDAPRGKVRALHHRADPAAQLAQQMGPSGEVAAIIEQVRMAAATPLTVLIIGETGTGKELVAQAIHAQSARHEHPLVAVDCGAIPEQLLESELFGHERGAFTGASQPRRGQFQVADGGTLFLDETSNLPAALQPKLLRVLESREVAPVGGDRRRKVDVRIIAATSATLRAEMGEGRFREDLYYRLAQFTIHLPALRERSGDIPCLAERFAREMCLELEWPIAGIRRDALERLVAHRWPGNVRELRNVVREAVVRCRGADIDRATIESLLQGDAGSASAASVRTAFTPGASLREVAERAVENAERAAICAVLRGCDGNKSAAARTLRTDYKTLHGKIKRYAIVADDYAPPAGACGAAS